MRSPNVLVQAIVVADDLDHLDAIHAGARASLLARAAHPDAPWADWLADERFTKTVRRATRAKVAALVDVGGVPSGPTVDAVAFAPMTYAEFPKPVARTQVQGTDFPRLATAVIVADPLVRIDVLDTLTTGKATAQAAHALWAALGDTGPTADDLLFDVHTVNVATLTAAAAGPDTWAVHDAGLTEIAAGTLTAVAHRTPQPAREGR